jgi:hypothetical protein
MPGDRPVKKGSFGSQLDELVKVFETRSPQAEGRERLRPEVVGPGVHDRLFEGA